MTTAEMIQARGRTEGWVEALLHGLTAEFGPLPDRISEMVRQGSSDQVQAWTARAMIADTLDQVFD